jgi:hypothetical protein
VSCALAEEKKRQSWSYAVKYAGGGVKNFVLPCPSLPIDVTKEKVLERYRTSTIQACKGEFDKIPILNNIKKLLHSRGKSDECLPSWELLFAKFPDNCDVEAKIICTIYIIFLFNYLF